MVHGRIRLKSNVIFFPQGMEQLNNLTSYNNMPEMSEVITHFLAGGEKQKPKAVKAAKKRQ